jgi:predicted small lipoprotein YifL
VVPVLRSARIGLAAVLCVLAVAACGDPGPAPEVAEGAAPAGQRPVALPDYPAGAVGDEPTEPEPMADQFGTEECVEQGGSHPKSPNVSTFRCRKGQMSIEVIGVLTVDEDEEHMRLVGRPANTPLPEVYDWYRTRVVPQLVGVAARRMP